MLNARGSVTREWGQQSIIELSLAFVFVFVFVFVYAFELLFVV